MAFGAGRREDPVETARSLIARNQLNEAILVLENVIRNDPERIREAENLLRTIRRIRGEYNLLFEELIEHIINNPDDLERTLEIIAEMEALDEFPNPRVRRQIDEARVTAQLAYDRTVLTGILETARESLAAGRHAEAVRTYLTGFSLQRREFEERGYGEIFQTAVESARAEIVAQATNFASRADDVVATARRLATDIRGGELERADAVFDALMEDIVALDEARSAVIAAHAVLVRQRSQVGLQFPDSPVDWHLVFLNTLTTGRQDVEQREGIVTIIDTAWDTAASEISDTIATRLAEKTQEYERFIEQAEWSRVTAETESIVQLNRLAQRALLLAERRFDVPEMTITEIRELELTDAATVEFARYDVGAESARVFADLSALVVQTDEAESLETENIEDLRIRRRVFESLYDELDILLAGWTDSANLYRDVVSEAIQTEDATRISSVIEFTTTRLGDEVFRAREGEVHAVVRAIEIEAERVEGTVDPITERITEIDTLLEGVDGSDDPDSVVVFRYPDRALEEYEELRVEAREVRDAHRAIVEMYGDEKPYVLMDDRFAEVFSVVDSQFERVREALARIDDGIARAESAIDEAVALIAEGRELITQARSAIAAAQLNPAENAWSDARDRFFEALELREDPDTRSETDALIRDVGLELQDLRNRLVVQEVRELVTEARALYGRDDYYSAREYLLTARELWAQTNPTDPNSEVESLLRLVSAAIAFADERDVTETHPLFPIVGNYLSLARSDFERGRNLYNSNNVAEGDILLRRALENLRAVRDIQANNWTAKLLELQITRLREPDNFGEIFRARYEEAVSRRSDDAVAALTDLQALREIQPGYRNIEALIVELEIELGLRPDPITQARIAESNRLLNQARGIADTTDRNALTVAASLLEQALEANPENTAARNLLDTVRVTLGGRATVALSAADEQQYRRAEAQFIEGNIAQAFVIVERLFLDENNRAYPPLIDLRRRISTRLGI